MSGGIDSSATALAILTEGYETSGLFGPADQPVQVLAQPLNPTKGLVSDLPTVSLGEESQKGPDSRIQRNCSITSWGLNVALRRIRDGQPVLVALFDQPRLFVVRGNGFSHMERAQDLAINTSLSDRVIGDITRLAGVLPAAEAQFGEVFVQSAARCFILGQLGVEGFDVLHRPAGVPDGSPFNLVGN